MEWISEIVSAITASLTGIGTALTSFLTSTFTQLFLITGESGAVTGVSNFGIFSFILMGLALAMSLTYFVVNLVRRKI